MLKKWIILLCFLWLCFLILWTVQNNALPLGFDHGIYQHLTNVIEKSAEIDSLPTYLKYQYEPFSGVFFYTLSWFIGENIFYSWWYIWIYLLTGLSLFLLWKNKKIYTFGSLLWLFLFLFSVNQYFNFFWSFGKQMFATFFFLLFLRYQKKIPVAALLIVACMSLHRLTGFVAIIYIFCNFIVYNWKNKKWPYLSLLFLWVGISLLTYILSDSVRFQIQPFLHTDLRRYILIPGTYGTGLSRINFLFYITPALLFLFFMYVNYIREKHNRFFWKNPLILSFMMVSIMVFFRSIAHTRLQSFVDLFIIIIITKILFQYISSKWIIIFIVIQSLLWVSFSSKWHTPFISSEENYRIKLIATTLPDSVHIVTLSPAYNAWMSKYTTREIFSLQQGIGQKLWTWKDRKRMQYDKLILCKNLWIIPGNIVIYTGAKEWYPATKDNKCLKEVYTWQDNARLFTYVRIK
jgi:hypothetical protein